MEMVYKRGHVCAVKICRNNSVWHREESTRYFRIPKDAHRFPKNEEQRMLWIQACMRADWTPSHRSVLCSQHFEAECFDCTSKSLVRLKPDAVPTLFSGYPEHLKKRKSYTSDMTTGGMLCAVKDCRNYRFGSKTLSFFRFPRDANRSRAWATVCGRPDLLDKDPEALYRNYRVCSTHFESSHYTSPHQNRLLPTAIPTKLLPPVLDILTMDTDSHFEETTGSDRLRLRFDVVPTLKKINQTGSDNSCGDRLGQFAFVNLTEFAKDEEEKEQVQKGGGRGEIARIKPKDLSKLTSPKGFCAVWSCRSSENVLYKFPNPITHKERFLRWLAATGDEDITDLSPHEMYKSYRICSKHFDKELYDLKIPQRAIPTLELPAPVSVLHVEIPNLPDLSTFKTKNVTPHKPYVQKAVQYNVENIQVIDLDDDSYVERTTGIRNTSPVHASEANEIYLVVEETRKRKPEPSKKFHSINILKKSSPCVKKPDTKSSGDELILRKLLVGATRQPASDEKLLVGSKQQQPTKDKKLPINFKQHLVEDRKLLVGSKQQPTKECKTGREIEKKSNDDVVSDENISIICRSCLQEVGKEDIFKVKCLSLTLHQMLEKCLPIKIEADDVLSNSICVNCKRELIKTYIFVTRFMKSELVLQAFKTEKLSLRENSDNDEKVREEEHIKARESVSRESIPEGAGRSPEEEDTTAPVQSPENTERASTPQTLPKAVTDILKAVKSSDHDSEMEELPLIASNTETKEQQLIKTFHSYAKVLTEKNLKEFFLINNDNTVLETVRTDNIMDSLKQRFPNAKIEIRRLGNRRRQNSKAKHQIRKIMFGRAPAPITCQHCDESFQTQKLLVTHCRLENHYPIYKCTTCFKSFRNKYQLHSHVKSHSTELTYMCDRCGMLCRHADSLSMHIKSKHEPKILKHSCSKCDKKFSSNYALKVHFRSHTKEKPYCCEKCGMVFSSTTNLRQHLRLHLGIKPYACVICNKAFAAKHQLQDHLATHTNERKFMCDLCGVRFRKSMNVAKHKKKYHLIKEETDKENTAALQCSMCSFLCADSFSLKLHTQRNHKSYDCTICPKSFGSQESLYQHRLKYHGGIKTFICKYCGKKFAKAAFLRLHLLVHTGEKRFQCEVCSKRFTQRHHLQSHILTHTGGRPYKCKYCDKAFAHQTTLIVHERTHTGITPHVCDFCNKGFGHSTNYKKHMLARHGIIIEPKKAVYRRAGARKEVDSGVDWEACAPWKSEVDKKIDMRVESENKTQQTAEDECIVYVNFMPTDKTESVHTVD